MHNSSTEPQRLIDGLFALSERKFEEVHAKSLDMMRTDVKDPVPYCLLGMITYELGNYPKARELYALSVQYGPKVVRYYACFAQVLLKLGELDLAKQIMDKAIKLGVKDAFIANMLGGSYHIMGLHEDAMQLFERAIMLNATPIAYHQSLAVCQQFLGHFDKAKISYGEMLKRDPDNQLALSNLIDLEKQTKENNYLDKLIPLFEQKTNDPDIALTLGHAIAKTEEDMGNYQASLIWLQKAKALKLKTFNDKILDPAPLFKATRQTYHTSMAPEKNIAEQAPIFVCGLPRTGTTLVDRILSSHMDVTSVGESQIFANGVKIATNAAAPNTTEIDILTKAAKTKMYEVGHYYLDQLKIRAQGAKRTVDKMPLLFLHAGLIHRALPNARIVVLRRGAMDSCLSNYRQLFNVSSSFYQYTCTLKSMAEYYIQFDQLMQHWRETLPKDRFMEIQYEDIVADQENQTRNLLDFCDLSWDDACMRFHENKAAIPTASSVQARQPLYSGSIGRWKKYGDGLDELKQALGNLADPD